MPQGACVETNHLTGARLARSVDQNWARRLGNACAHLNRFSLCERAFGQATVVAFPPQLLHLRSPDLPYRNIPRTKIRAASSRTSDIDCLLRVSCSLLFTRHPPLIAIREASLKVCEAPHITGSLPRCGKCDGASAGARTPPSRLDRAAVFSSVPISCMNVFIFSARGREPFDPPWIITIGSSFIGFFAGAYAETGRFGTEIKSKPSWAACA
jgi:hypothetical protein